ncbi:MAG: hypothetical protein ACSLE6_01445 [Mycobacterium sp.]
MQADFEYVSYEGFGRRFFQIAVTEERVGAAFAEIAGGQFDIGPIRQGPGNIAKILAKVKVAQPQVSRTMGDEITFGIRIPLTIDLVIDLKLDKPRFLIDGEISLSATARAAAPLLLIIDVDKPRQSDITVNVSSKTLRGELVRIVGGVDAELKRFIAAHVAEQIDSPESQAAQIIDVADQLDTAWTGI